MSKLKAEELTLYKGQKIRTSFGDVLEIVGVDRESFILENGLKLVPKENDKLILRKLNQITLEELREFERTFNTDKREITSFECVPFYGRGYSLVTGSWRKGFNVVTNPLWVDWLTRKGFAIREEFERGVAVKEPPKPEVIGRTWTEQFDACATYGNCWGCGDTFVNVGEGITGFCAKCGSLACAECGGYLEYRETCTGELYICKRCGNTYE